MPFQGPESGRGEKSGKLTPKALKRALYLVENNRFVGNIHVSFGEEEKHIYFTVGGIRLLTAGSRRKTPLGKLLVRYGKLTPAMMREALQTQKRTGRRIGHVLTSVLKYVEPGEIEKVVQTQVENEIFDVITWEDGVFEYTHSMPDALFNKKLKATTLSLDIPELIERIKERIDRWPIIKSRIPDLGGIYRLSRIGHRRLIEGDEGGPGFKELADFLDGKRSLARVIEEGEFGTYEACDMVDRFLEKDWAVRVGGVSDRASVSDATDVFEEIQMLERALDLDPLDDAVRVQLVGVLEKGGVRDRAGVHLRNLAETKSRAGDVEEAQALLEKAVKLNPTDFEGHEQLYEVYVLREQDEKAFGHGLRLAEMYRANHLFNRTKKIIAKILNSAPRSIKGHTLLAETHEELQESQSAVLEFEIVAAILKEEGKDEIRLKGIFERILQIDDRHRPARKELNRLMRKGHRRFSYYLRTGAILLVALLAFGFVFYETAGRITFEDMRVGVFEKAGNEDFDGAKKEIENFRVLFPLFHLGRLEKASRVLEERRRKNIEVETRKFATAEEAVFKDPTPKKLEASAARIRKKLQTHVALQEGKFRADLEGLMVRIRKILVPWGRVKSAAMAGKSKKAFNEYRALVEIVPGFHSETEFPPIGIPFTVHPRGALVALDGAALPPGATKLNLRIGKVHRVQVSYAGFQTLEKSVEVAGAAWPLVLPLTKKVVWKTAVGGPVEGAALVHEGDVYVPSRNRCLSCLDLGTGKVKWRFWTGLHGDLDTGPALHDGGSLLFCARDRRLYGLEAASARLDFREDLGAPCAHKPVFFREKGSVSVLLALADGRVVRRFLGEGSRTCVLFRMERPILAGPAQFQGILVVGDDSGRFLAFDLVASKQKWEAALDGPVRASPIIQEGTVFVGTGEGKMYALNLAEGTLLPGWPVSIGSPVTSTPAIHGELLLAGTEDGQLVAVNRHKGAFSWRIPVKGSILTTPVTDRNSVYVGTDDGALYAVDIATRAVRWKFETGGAIRSTPRLCEGMILFGSRDGFFYAVKR